MKAIVAVAAAILFVHPALAGDINQRQGLDPRINSKVNNIIAKGWTERSGTSGGITGNGGDEINSAGSGGSLNKLMGPQYNVGCGNQNVGNTYVQKGAQAPREVNTVIKGDVINVNRGGAGCR